MTTLQKSLKDAQKELDQSLSQVAQVGVYVVVLENIDPYDSKNSLVQKAQAALHPYAVENLNGVNIKRLTNVANFESVKDIIESFVSGKASDKKVFVDKQNFARKYFLYVAQASVLPLKENKMKRQNMRFDSDVFVAKLGDNFESELLKKNISDEHLALIRTDALPYASISQQENRNNRDRQDQIIEKGELEIKKIKQDIEEAQELLRERSERIQQICKNYNLSFNASDLDASAQGAFDHFREKVKRLDRQWKQLKEQEIIPKETITTIEGSPAASTATESIKLYKTLSEQAGKISKTQERIRVEDFEVTDYEAQKDVTLFRKIERIWVYPVPQDGNTFKVFLLAQFKIAATAAKDREKSITLDFPMPEMVFVTGGSYIMGCKDGRDTNCDSDEKPARQVSVKDFAIGRYEVTVKEYLAFVDDTKGNYPSWLEEGNEYHIETGLSNYYKRKGYSRNAFNLPIVGVSWYDAVAYCKWLSKQTGKNYRLPTEAEWEFAARGGSNQNSYKYAGSDDVDKVAWYSDNSSNKTHPVGEKQGLRIGNDQIFDLSGNVWEWCADHWYSSYKGALSNGSAWTSGGESSRRVVRGGSWLDYSYYCRVADRFCGFTNYRYYDIGFRVARY